MTRTPRRPITTVRRRPPDVALATFHVSEPGDAASLQLREP